LIIVEVTKCGWLSEYITLYLLLPIGAIEGLLVGWGEAEPLDMRYQAEPGNELNLVFEFLRDRPSILETGFLRLFWHLHARFC
jgi:hypothetical protein